METKIKLAAEKTARTNEITPKIRKRGLVGIWKGKIKINDDIDNIFNLAL